MKTMKLWMATLLVACAGAAGCTSDYEVEFKGKTNPPLETTISDEQMVIPAGIAVGISAEVKRGDEQVKEGVEFLSDDPQIVQIAPISGEGGFVVFGVAEGEGAISMMVDGIARRSIPVTVTSQN